MSATAYLDHNATAPVRPEVVRAMAECWAEVGNPSSVHAFGRAARRRVEAARSQVAALIGACADDVVFTSGGTEANVLALRGCGRTRLLVSAVEHDSVLKAADAEIIPVDGNGIIDLDALDALLGADAPPAAVSVMLANNETGVIQPVAAVAALARARGALVHCDASQAAGKIPVAMAELGVDLLTLSAHKLGGPQGVGALVAGGDAAVAAQIPGGGQERGRRAGTENVAGIVGFGVAADSAGQGLGWLAPLRDQLEQRARALAPGCRVMAEAAPRLPNTSCLSLPGMASDIQVMALDLAGIAVSAGSACSSGKVRSSHVLAAMKVPEAQAGAAIRVSLGWNSTAADVERFLAAWADLAARAAQRAAAA